MKLKTIAASMPALTTLFNKDMPATAAMHISLNIKRLEDHAKAVAEKEMELFRKHGKPEKTDKGDGYIVPEENMEAFKAEHEALLDEEVEVQVYQIKLEDIESSVKPKELHNVHWLFEGYGEV